MSVFVADDHGELVAAATMDGAAPDTRLNAQRKAYTAARSDAPSTASSPRSWRDNPAELRELRPVLHLLRGRRGRLRGRASRRRRSASAGCPGDEDERARPRRDRARPAWRDRDDAALVGLDVGTTGVKAIAISPTGEVLAQAEEEYPLSTPRPGLGRAGPRGLVARERAALARLDVRDVAGIGLSGQMHGLVALDARGRVLRPAMLWNDQRTAAECAEIEERVGLDRLIALTGNRALTGLHGAQAPLAAQTRARRVRRIAHVLLPKDYVRLRLTGERATDVADASGTLLFDVAGRRWSDEVLTRSTCPRAWLPPALESPEISGLTAGRVPVAAGAGDQAAGALGVGVDRPGPLSVAIGTSGVVFAALPSFAADPEARVHAFCHAVPEPGTRWA